MPSLVLDSNTAKFSITGWRPGLLRVNEQQFTCSIIVAADTLLAPWAVTTAAALSLEPALQLQPGILLIGTGLASYNVPLNLYGTLLANNIGVEIMSTPAACRTFNALSAELRPVVAALILPSTA